MPVLHPAEIWEALGALRRRRRLQAQGTRARARPSCSRITHEGDRRAARHRRRSAAIATCRRSGYHIQIKERDEQRPQGGVLRTREFTMKDSYTLDRDQGRARRRVRPARDGLRPDLHPLRPRLLQGRVRHGDHGRDDGARVHGAVQRGRGSRGRAAVAATTPRTSRWRPSRISQPRSSRPPAPIAEVETPNVTTIDSLARFLGIDPAHDEQGDAPWSPTTARSGSRSCAATGRLHEMKLSKAFAPGDARRHAGGGSRARVSVRSPGRSGPVGIREGAPRRHRRRRDAARGRLGDRRRTAPAGTSRASRRRATTSRRSPTSTRSRTATAARSATAC